MMRDHFVACSASSLPSGGVCLGVDIQVARGGETAFELLSVGLSSNNGTPLSDLGSIDGLSAAVSPSANDRLKNP